MSTDRSTTGNVLRRFTLGSGPLKRGSDRVQFLARVLLACSLLTALPIALAVATATHTQAQAEAAVQLAERHQVDATLTEDAPLVRGSSETAPPSPRAAVVWTRPGGLEGEDRVIVPVGAKAGSTVRIWVDREGERTLPPLTDGDVTARSIANALLTYLIIALLACGTYFLFRRALDRTRMRRWESDWAVVEPVWTRSVL